MSGIQSHSLASAWAPVVIFAIDAASNNRDAQQIVRGVIRFKQWCGEQGLGVKEVFGSYKGKQEASFVMSEAAFRGANIGETWCSHQESLLHLTGQQEPNKPDAGYRLASLYYPASGELVSLGRWHCVTAEVARAAEAWTFDVASGLFWLAGEAVPFVAAKPIVVDFGPLPPLPLAA